MKSELVSQGVRQTMEVLRSSGQTDGLWYSVVAIKRRKDDVFINRNIVPQKDDMDATCRY